MGTGHLGKKQTIFDFLSRPPSQSLNTIKDQAAVIESLFQFAHSAIRYPFFMNGAATIAGLAFMGKIFEAQPAYVASFAWCLVPYVLGVSLAAIGSGLAYLTQFQYASGVKMRGDNLRIYTIGVFIGSHAMFFLGSFFTLLLFITFDPASNQPPQAQPTINSHPSSPGIAALHLTNSRHLLCV